MLILFIFKGEIMTTKLGIKMWGGRRYVVEVNNVPAEESPYWQTLSKSLRLDVYQGAEVIINLDTLVYLKNKYGSRLIANTLDTVVYLHGNAQQVTPEELQELVKEFYAERKHSGMQIIYRGR